MADGCSSSKLRLGVGSGCQFLWLHQCLTSPEEVGGGVRFAVSFRRCAGTPVMSLGLLYVISKFVRVSFVKWECTVQSFNISPFFQKKVIYVQAHGSQPRNTRKHTVQKLGDNKEKKVDCRLLWTEPIIKGLIREILLDLKYVTKLMKVSYIWNILHSFFLLLPLTFLLCLTVCLI
jgi:hypothetical protein